MNKEPTIKIAIIGTVGVPANYGGFETLAHHLVLFLGQQLDITVYCSKKEYAKNKRPKNWEKATLRYLPLSANGAQSIFYDLWSILDAIIRKVDVLLILGVSACLFLPIIKLFSNKKIIVNIDGLEWRRPKWNVFAKWYLRLSEKIACLFADEIITDNSMLSEYVNIRYSKKSLLVGYGGNHVQEKKPTKRDYFQYPFLKEEYAIKVARIEPENNIELILNAFSLTPKHLLVVIGNWEASTFGRMMKDKYNAYLNIFLLDPIYIPETLNILRSNATLYIHGHSAGGTNPSLVEAMCYGLPILSFDVVYNRVTTNNEAIYFESEAELLTLLKNINNYSLLKIGTKLKEIGARKYQWHHIAIKYLNIFRSAVGVESIGEQVFTLKSWHEEESKQLVAAYTNRKIYNAEKFKETVVEQSTKERKIRKVS